jgi:hypothetical protein
MAKSKGAEEQKEGKDRMAFYLTDAQREKVKLLAFESDVSHSKIVGDLIDAAREPSLKRG